MYKVYAWGGRAERERGNDASGGRGCTERGENDCVEGVRGIRLSFPGSSGRRYTPPKDDGREGEGKAQG
jgi:hypothetical protein